MLIPVDCDKSHMYIIVPRTNTKKTIQRDMLKNTINRSRWNPKQRTGRQEIGKEEQNSKETNRK